MDDGLLLNVSASFERIALAVEREGIDGHVIERIAGLGSVLFGRGITRAHARPMNCVTVRVRDWKAYTVYSDTHLLALARCLRELAYLAKAERLGFDDERLDPALDIAAEPAKWPLTYLESARNTLRAYVRYGRNEDLRERAKQYILDINSNLEDRHADAH